MGRSSSHPNIEKQLEQGYKYIRRYSNGCYGELTVIERKSTHKLYALKQFVTQSETIDKRLSARQAKHHPGLIRLVEYWVKEQTSLCSNLKQVYLRLDYEERTLQDELLQRQMEERQWSQLQICQLLMSLVSVLYYLHENGITHNNISLKSILLGRDGEVRVLEPELISLYSSKSEYVLPTGQASPFVAPQVLQLSQTQMMSQSYLMSIDFARSSVFSIGILMLSMYFLNENIEQELIIAGEYDFGHVRKLSQIVCDSYEVLASFLPGMLRKQPEQRPDLYELHQSLTARFYKENVNVNSVKELRYAKMPLCTKAMMDTKIIPSRKLL